MKYFENLPKKSFTTTIGDFSISSFFTYIDISNVNLTTDEVITDSRLNLLEQSSLTYNDPNSFWFFVLSNKTINPFTLLAENTNIFLTTNIDKLSLDLTDTISGITNYVFPKGSIVLPYIANSGSSSSYSSVGNFDLNSALSIIESSFYYDEDMILKQQRGGTSNFINITGSTGQPLVIITPIPGGTYTIQKQYFPKNVKNAVDKTISIEALDASAIEIDASWLPSISPTKPKSTSNPSKSASTIPGLSGGNEITAIKSVESTKKSILGVIPNQTGLFRSYFITTKYN
jgi:hypothetical protein